MIEEKKIELIDEIDRIEDMIHDGVIWVVDSTILDDIHEWVHSCDTKKNLYREGEILLQRVYNLGFIDLKMLIEDMLHLLK